MVTAKIVKHNYGNPDMFSYENAIEMERKELSDGVYGYQVTTDKVDWEYGQRWRTKHGEKCGTRLGRIRRLCMAKTARRCTVLSTTASRPWTPTSKFLFGSCLHDCPAGWRDAAYCRKPLTEALSSTTRLDLGNAAAF